jgi:hypothetical protein
VAQVAWVGMKRILCQESLWRSPQRCLIVVPNERLSTPVQSRCVSAVPVALYNRGETRITIPEDVCVVERNDKFGREPPKGTEGFRTRSAPLLRILPGASKPPPLAMYIVTLPLLFNPSILHDPCGSSRQSMLLPLHPGQSTFTATCPAISCRPHSTVVFACVNSVVQPLRHSPACSRAMVNLQRPASMHAAS